LHGSRVGGSCTATLAAGIPSKADWIIGLDESSGEFCALYSDDRGVSGIYEMNFNGRTWKMWRSATGFHQRKGRISDDGMAIGALWERSPDGKDWHDDFDITFRKMARK
jgi:hypothetical protein